MTIRQAAVDYIHTPEGIPAEERRKKLISEETKRLSNNPTTVLRIARLDIIDGEVGYVNRATRPSYRVFVTRGNLELRNLSNHSQLGPATAALKGRFMGSGILTAKAEFRASGDKPDFDLNLKIEESELRRLNEILCAYAKLDVVGGRFSFYTQVKVRNGYLTGYVKPLFHDVDVCDPVQDRKKGLLKKVYEAVVGGLAKVFENRKRQEVATVTTISGPVGYTTTNTMQIIGNLIQNAFFKAILPGFERSSRTTA